MANEWRVGFVGFGAKCTFAHEKSINNDLQSNRNGKS
jgi:hypothetical protein